MATTAVMRNQLFINGEWRDAAGGKTLEVVNPATEEVIAEVASPQRLPAAADRQLCVLNVPWARPIARAASTICAASTPVSSAANAGVNCAQSSFTETMKLSKVRDRSGRSARR